MVFFGVNNNYYYENKYTLALIEKSIYDAENVSNIYASITSLTSVQVVEMYNSNLNICFVCLCVCYCMEVTLTDLTYYLLEYLLTDRGHIWHGAQSGHGEYTCILGIMNTTCQIFRIMDN